MNVKNKALFVLVLPTYEPRGIDQIRGTSDSLRMPNVCKQALVGVVAMRSPLFSANFTDKNTIGLQ